MPDWTDLNQRDYDIMNIENSGGFQGYDDGLFGKSFDPKPYPGIPLPKMNADRWAVLKSSYAQSYGCGQEDRRLYYQEALRNRNASLHLRTEQTLAKDLARERELAQRGNRGDSHER